MLRKLHQTLREKLRVLRDWRVKRAATVDVLANVPEAPELVVEVELGLRPSIKADDPQHAAWLRDAKGDARLPRWTVNLEKVQRERAKHHHATSLSIVFVVLLGAEFLGGNSLLRDQGYENPHVIIISAAMAALLTFLLLVMSRQKGGSIAYYTTIGSLAVIACTVAIQRHSTVQTEDSSRLVDIATTLFLVAVTFGPAAMAKVVWQELVPVMRLVREERLLRRLIKKATHRQQEAQRRIENLAMSMRWWDQEAAQITALYRQTYRLRKAQQNPYGGRI